MNISIGDLSRRTGIKVPTIRYYEQIGLIAPPPRTEGQQRRYGTEDVRRLNFIRHARELGLEVAAIRELLAMEGRPDESCSGADSIARRHLEDVERRISRLMALRDELRLMIDACGHGRVRDCRVLETLADDGHEHGKLA